MLDAAIAKMDGSDVTTIFRKALAEFVKSRSVKEGRKMDEFLEDSAISNPIYKTVLTPKELRRWSENELLQFAKRVRSRKMELDWELRRRGYYFRW